MPDEGWPMVWSFHAIGVDAERHASADGPLRAFGRTLAIVVHCEGWPPAAAGEDGPIGWHAAGSAGYDVDGGEDGPICDPVKVREWYCYESCRVRGHCTNKTRGEGTCRYSHCLDDVAFVLEVLHHIRARIPVDDSRIFATGDSSGGILLHELAADHRSLGVFAAIAPICALPSNGFNRGTLDPRTRCLQLAGTKDGFVSAAANLKSEQSGRVDPTRSYGENRGWFWSSMDNTTDLWASQKGLVPRLEGGMSDLHPELGAAELRCRGWSADGSVERAELAECYFEEGHCFPGSHSRRLVWRFFGFEDPIAGVGLDGECGAVDGECAEPAYGAEATSGRRRWPAFAGRRSDVRHS
ncbi:unnamed protein product [Prorocentrum cordatum]|uniref:Feruloyl esterase n=1 Tax=Prorocentrum cordatum TaxID=2364126 RepID=A0ABN9TCR6_9DINO|nr:unnamed protein product [Polarella glacialis]